MVDLWPPRQGRQPSATTRSPAGRAWPPQPAGEPPPAAPAGPPRLAPDEIRAALHGTLSDSDLRSAFPDPGRLEQRVLEHAAEIEHHLTPELTALGAAEARYAMTAARSSRRVTRARWAFGVVLLPFLGYAAVAVYGLLFATGWISVLWDPTDFLDDGDPETSPAGSAFFLLLGSVMFAAPVYAGYRVLIHRFRRPVPSAAAERSRCEQTLREALKVEVAGLARRLGNTEEFRAERSVVALSTTTAPLLVEQDYAKDTISSATQRTVVDLIREHRSSAIGIAGPRGVGKSTIMRVLESGLPEFLTVYVPVPVYYSATDFVRHLHGEVARAVIRRHLSQGAAPAGVNRFGRAAVVVLVAVAAVATTLAAAGVFGPESWEQTRLGRWPLPEAEVLALGGVTAAAAAYLIWRWERQGRLAETEQPRDPVTLARRELERLAWRTSLQTRTRWSVPLAKASFEREGSRGQEERELSHPDTVAAFRQFIQAYSGMEGSLPLVVTVDELDKIADPEQAVDLINGAKDLLHIDRTHFVISVSEDALASYALRGMSVRDVFDSAFDVVLDVKPLAAAESIALLERRVLDFPVPVGLLCHSVSGGLPRDLIRLARSCVSTRRASAAPVSIPALADALTRHELIGALDGALRRGVDGDDDIVEILRLRERLLSGAPMVDATFADVSVDLAGRSGMALQVFARSLATAAEYFSVPRDRQTWQAMQADGTALECAAALAEVERTLAISPAAAAERLLVARALCGLEGGTAARSTPQPAEEPPSRGLESR